MYRLKTTTIYLKCSQFCGSAVWAGFSWMILLVSSGFTDVSAITVTASLFSGGQMWSAEAGWLRKASAEPLPRCFMWSLIFQQASPVLFTWQGSQETKQRHTRFLEASAQKWHTKTSTSFSWLKQVIRLGQTQGTRTQPLDRMSHKVTLQSVVGTEQGIIVALFGWQTVYQPFTGWDNLHFKETQLDQIT